MTLRAGESLQTSSSDRYYAGVTNGPNEASVSKGLHVLPLDLRTTTPLQRILLIADGTVTSLLEAYFQQTIIVSVIDQESNGTSVVHCQLDLPVGAIVLTRRVTLSGSLMRQVLCHAT